MPTTSPAPPTSPSTAALVHRFAATMNATHATEHAITSPLGLWLLLALVAPTATGPSRTELEAALGTTASDAAARAAALLDAPHPAVSAAAALWVRAALMDRRRLHRFLDTLPTAVARGPMPTQDQADQWVTDRTGGQLTSLPAEIDAETAVILASALAAKVSWSSPFTDATPQMLGGEFEALGAAALTAPDEHTVTLMHTDAAGLVAVHTADAVEGVRVVSVLAGPDVPAAAVHQATSQVCAALTGDAAPARDVDVFDLPLGEGPLCSVTESRELVWGATEDRVVAWRAHLPAWSAQSRHDLEGVPGVAAALAALGGLLSETAGIADGSATQVARAQYTRDGFEAAAVTALTVRAAGMPSRREVTRREVTVRFNRPFAVVALAQSTATDPDQPWRQVDVAGPGWGDLPVFSAWVADPSQ